MFAHSNILFCIRSSACPDCAARCAWHDTGLFCLDGRVLAGSVDLDQTLRNKASALGPPCLLLVWDVKYMQVMIYFVL